MEYLEIGKWITLVANFGIGAVLGGGIVYYFIKSYIPSYLSEKAKNLATREDIGYITDKVEKVRSDYAQLLEEIRSNYQLEFAAIEREKKIRKEVYMDAVEAMMRNQTIIASFANLNRSEEQITSTMPSDTGKMAKVQIVGSKETVRAVTEYMTASGAATLDLMLGRSKLMLQKISISNLEDLCNESQQEIDRYISIMDNMNLEGNLDQRRWDTVNRNIEFHQKQYKKYLVEKDELWQIQNREHMAFIRKCMKRYFEILALQPKVVLSVRSELDLEISSEDYLDIFNRNIEKEKAIFNDFMSKVERGDI